MNQLKAGAVLAYFVLALQNIVALLYTPFLLRMLGKTEFGLYSIISAIIAYLSILDFGFAGAIVRYTAKYRAEGRLRELPELFGLFMIIFVVIGIVALVVGGGVYLNVENLFGGAMERQDLVRVRVMMLMMIGNLALTFPLSVFSAINAAHERFVFQRIVQICRITLVTSVMICLLFLGYKAVALVVVLVVFNVAALFSEFVYCRFVLGVRVKVGTGGRELIREISSYSFYGFLGAIMDRIFWSTGQIVLGAVSGASSVAAYAVAVQLAQMYMNFSSAISGVFLPKVTGMVASGRADAEISDLFLRAGRIQFLIVSLVLSGFVLFGSQFVRVWAGGGYGEVYGMALLFLVPLTVPLVQNVGISILQARNRVKFRSVLYACIAVCCLGVQLVLAPRLGGYGCAFAVAAALGVGQIVVMNFYYKVSQNIDVVAFWKSIFRMTVFPAALCGFLYPVVNMFGDLTIVSLAIGCGGYAVAFAVGSWFFSMNASERNLISAPLSRLFAYVR